MKRILRNITLASVLTLVAYLIFYAVWGAILSGVEDPSLKLILIAVMTTAVFGALLLYISKVRRSVGEDEVVSDYKGGAYVSFIDDLKLIIKRESKVLICITAIVFACFALNTLDHLLFEKKVISFPTFFFAPMYLFGTVFRISFIGYALSALLDNTVYMIFLLLFRKKKYDYWMKSKI